MNRDSGAGFFTGLIIGAVIGAAVGMLYAPRAGEETRKFVKEKVSRAGEAASKTAGRVKETIGRRMNK
jgi:gas vesicle protein